MEQFQNQDTNLDPVHKEDLLGTKSSSAKQMEMHKVCQERTDSSM